MDGNVRYEPDWRTAIHSRVDESDPPDPDPEFAPGSLIVEVDIGERRGGSLVSFPQPSAAAMALNLARQAAEKAMALQPQISYSDVPKGLHGRHLESVTAGTESILFDYIEQCMVAATFSFQALEAYCNLTIDRHVRDTYPWPDRKGATQKMTSGQLEFFYRRKTSSSHSYPLFLM